MRRKVTILDVARRAGMSMATVSYVLNRARSVGEHRWRQVLKAAAELNYTPNALAQGVRRGRVQVIGICVPTTQVTRRTFRSMLLFDPPLAPCS